MPTTAERPATAPGRTTGIGSLPHHNVDAALEHSFRAAIPYLPQIPIRNPWEYMIAQALEGIPGLLAESDGTVTLDRAIWSSRAKRFDERLARAFEKSDEPEAFAAFEPEPSISSCWQPFVWELAERGVKRAKIQIAGPMTAQWALKVAGSAPGTSTSVDALPGLSNQIFRLVLARSIAMVRRLKAAGVTEVLLFLDEPGLYALVPPRTAGPLPPMQLIALQELRLAVQALKREGATVGIHCCSDTAWDSVLATSPHILSLDAHLSLEKLLETPGPALESFLAGGGRLSLGVVPTSLAPREPERPAITAEGLIDHLSALFARHADSIAPARAQGILQTSLLTPACGLALHPAEQAEQVLTLLLRIETLLEQARA